MATTVNPKVPISLLKRSLSSLNLQAVSSRLVSARWLRRIQNKLCRRVNDTSLSVNKPSSPKHWPEISRETQPDGQKPVRD